MTTTAILVALVLATVHVLIRIWPITRRPRPTIRWVTLAATAIGVLACVVAILADDYRGPRAASRLMTLAADPKYSADVAAWCAVAATLIIAASVAYSGYRLRKAERRRGRQHAMTEAHVAITTGETASARHLIGELLSSTPGGFEQEAKIHGRRQEYIMAFYTLLWTREFLDNLRKMWTRGTNDGKESTFLKWNDEALVEDIEQTYALLIKDDPDFVTTSARAWKSFQGERSSSRARRPR
ncbi:hypothetical protein [Clavibacter zhangzhiyongii]|uniref:hypothetical protein n=1 Tax=Clavibacter TaxID=1573 RepID=UPI0039DF5FCE